MLNSATRTAKDSFEVVLYLDDDDPTRSEYPEVRTIVGPRINLGPAYNVLLKEVDADLYMMGADDLFFREPWMGEIWSLTPKDLICAISFDDCSGNRGKPREHGHPFVGKGLIEKLGYVAHPDLGHSCIDNWIVKKAKALERFFISEVRIEHVHPKYKKAEWDQTYLDNTRELKEKDGLIYKALT